VSDFSICVATPTNNAMVNLTYTRSMVGLAVACSQRGINFQYLTTSFSSVLPAARNLLVDRFLSTTDLTHLLFIDSDMGFDPAELISMFDYAHRDVVAAMCPSKTLNWDNLAHVARAYPNMAPAELAEVAGTFGGMINLVDGQSFAVQQEPVEVATIGTGIMLISRDILNRLAVSPVVPHHIVASESRTIPAFFDNGVTEDNRYVGEDFIFCRRVREIGGSVWGCPWLRITHSGNFDFVGNLPAVARLP
jgi:hypothetical protein